jgi:hypothetical protein
MPGGRHFSDRFAIRMRFLTCAPATAVMRVIKQGGAAQFIVHARVGVTCVAGNREIKDIDELLEDIDIFSVAKDAIRHVHFVESAGASAPATARETAKSAYDDFYRRLQRIGNNWQAALT